jgi:2-polyprenyl-3-methyl-5-hydroxy-6-metoxy-1,4-benzoquinol methylase
MTTTTAEPGRKTGHQVSRPAADAPAFYSEIAADFHKSYRTDANRLERIKVWQEFLDRHAGGATFAYDIGCGSGILACELAKRGIETVGIDGAPGMVDLARRSAQEAGIANVTFQLHRLPISDISGYRRAEIIISSSAIEYLDSIRDALVFVCELLRPGGTVIFSVSNRSSWSRAVVRFVHQITGYPAYLKHLKHFMSVPEIKSEVEAAGLKYVDHAFFARSDRINRVLGSMLPQRFSSNMIIVVASSQPV